MGKYGSWGSIDEPQSTNKIDDKFKQRWNGCTKCTNSQGRFVESTKVGVNYCEQCGRPLNNNAWEDMWEKFNG